MGVKEADAVVAQLQTAGVELLLVLEVEKVIAQLLCAYPVRRAAAMLPQLLHGAQVGLLRSFTEPRKLRVVGHALA